MGIQSVKVQHHNHHHHQFTRGLPWDQYEAATNNNNLLSLVCKRLRPLAPKISPANNNNTTTVETFDLKSFIRPDHGCLRKPLSSLDHDHKKKEPAAAVQLQPGAAAGTRWNPTQEQIGILETLYKNGMRTPNAHQIEHITAQLREYGKIEGKNVFYWFQNHKARDRQKHKRNNNPSGKYSTPNRVINTITTVCGLGEELEGSTPYKRKCSAWSFDQRVEEENYGLFMHEGEDRTLKLFPLHPEGRFLN